jgi:hypothetical protein
MSENQSDLNPPPADSTEETTEVIRPIVTPEPPPPPLQPPSAAVPPAPVPPLTPIRRPGPPIGTIILGAILILVGLGWLLQTTDVVDFSLGIVLPGALMLIGLGLIASARTGTHGGLIALGIILTVLLAAASFVNVPLKGSVGDFTANPTSIQDVKSEYDLIAGQQTIDLRDVAFPSGETTIKVRHGMGQVNIWLPRDVGAQVLWKITAGEADVLGRTQNGGFLDDQTSTTNYASAPTRVRFDVELGLGQIEVQQ